MLNVVPEIMERTQSQIAQQAMLLVIVWADNGAEDRLITSYRLAGTNDAAAALDTNTNLNYAGDINLATGAAIALDVTTGASGTPQKTKSWGVIVTDIWREVWA